MMSVRSKLCCRLRPALILLVGAVASSGLIGCEVPTPPPGHASEGAPPEPKYVEPGSKEEEQLRAALGTTPTPAAEESDADVIQEPDVDAGTNNAPIRHADFVFDGNNNDWNTVRPQVTEAGRADLPSDGRIDVKGVYLTNDQEFLYLFVETKPTIDDWDHKTSVGPYAATFFFDVDNNRATGEAPYRGMSDEPRLKGHELAAVVTNAFYLSRDGSENTTASVHLQKVHSNWPYSVSELLQLGTRRVNDKIAFGSHGVEFALPLTELRIKPGDLVRILVEEAASKKSGEEYNEFTYHVQGGRTGGEPSHAKSIVKSRADQPLGFITTPINAYFSAGEKISHIQIMDGLKKFRALKGRRPRDFAEVEAEVLKPRGIRLPALKVGESYIYDPDEGPDGDILIRSAKP